MGCNSIAIVLLSEYKYNRNQVTSYQDMGLLRHIQNLKNTYIQFLLSISIKALFAKTFSFFCLYFVEGWVIILCNHSKLNFS